MTSEVNTAYLKHMEPDMKRLSVSISSTVDKRIMPQATFTEIHFALSVLVCNFSSVIAVLKYSVNCT